MTLATEIEINKSHLQQMQQQSYNRRHDHHQQQQQENHHQHHQRSMQHLHLQQKMLPSTWLTLSFWWTATTAVTFVIFGLLLAGNCVSGQIDGYLAGVDYPAYEAVPKGLAFKCQGRQPGYYADTETRCQVWHWCLHSGHQYSFLCPNGTVFNQAVRVCDWWSNVNCPASEQLYQNNDELYRVPVRNAEQNDI